MNIRAVWRFAALFVVSALSGCAANQPASVASSIGNTEMLVSVEQLSQRLGDG
jgi:hypothetical protein